jgi:hypothetical protein
MRLVDVIGPDGTTQTLKSNTWGVFIINDQLAKAAFDDTDVAALPVDNDNLQCVSHRPTARLADSWAIAAYTSGFTMFYRGDDEISAERRVKNAISFGDPDCNASRVYGEGDFLCQVLARKMRGTVKTAVPHPSTNTYFSRLRNGLIP